MWNRVNAAQARHGPDRAGKPARVPEEEEDNYIGRFRAYLPVRREHAKVADGNWSVVTAPEELHGSFSRSPRSHANTAARCGTCGGRAFGRGVEIRRLCPGPAGGSPSGWR